jgi:hypothetical protein
MWSRSYRKHVIMAFPSFDTATNSWAPQADISWPTGPVRESEFVRFPLRVLSEAEAVACALNRGKSWIDRRLKHSHSSRELAVQGIPVLQDRLARKSLARIQPRRASAPTDDSLSFDEFKSAVVKVGGACSERLLRKSYDALIKLRKNANYSWAQIQVTVKRSQEIMTSHSAAPHGRKKRTILPLTQRDWQRIV